MSSKLAAIRLVPSALNCSTIRRRASVFGTGSDHFIVEPDYYAIQRRFLDRESFLKLVQSVDARNINLDLKLCQNEIAAAFDRFETLKLNAGDCPLKRREFSGFKQHQLKGAFNMLLSIPNYVADYFGSDKMTSMSKLSNVELNLDNSGKLSNEDDVFFDNWRNAFLDNGFFEITPPHLIKEKVLNIIAIRKAVLIEDSYLSLVGIGLSNLITYFALKTVLFADKASDPQRIFAVGPYYEYDMAEKTVNQRVCASFLTCCKNSAEMKVEADYLSDLISSRMNLFYGTNSCGRIYPEELYLPEMAKRQWVSKPINDRFCVTHLSVFDNFLSERLRIYCNIGKTVNNSKEFAYLIGGEVVL